MNATWKKRLHAGFAALVLLFVTILPMKGLNRIWQDFQVDHAPRADPSGRVVVVAIDDEIISRIGPWPWDRGQTARLFLAIASQHPKVLAFDGYFPHRAEATAGDFLLAQSFRDIAKSGTRLILPFSFLDASTAPDSLDTGVELPPLLRTSAYQLLPDKPGADLAILLQSSRILYGDTLYQQFSSPAGFINSPVDAEDGTCRRIPHVVRFGSEYLPSFAVAAVAAYGDANLADVSFEPGQVQILRNKIPLDHNGNAALRFYGESPAMPQIKAGELMENPAKFREMIRGKIVVVGVTAAAALNRESGDFLRTVLSDRYPGVEIWALGMDNILSGRVPSSSGWMRMWELLLGAGLAAGIWTLLVRLGWEGRTWGILSFGVFGVLIIQAILDRLFVVQSAIDLPVLGYVFGLTGAWAFRKPVPRMVLPTAPTMTAPGTIAGQVTSPILPVHPGNGTLPPGAMDGPPRIGKYELVSELGRGAMGVVHKGYDRSLDRFVAIKVISASRRLGDRLTENMNRFQREARAIASLNHPSIVTIYEMDEWDGCSYIAMELLEGPALDKLLLEHKLPWKAVRAWGLQLLEALAYAHSKGVVHRDIKPANVMAVDQGRRVKLTDFGLALHNDSTLTQEGQILGTPYYMAPELIDGQKGDGRSDQFALGVVLYEMLSRRRPFEGDEVRQIMLQILMHPAPSLAEIVGDDVPAEAIACIDRMMAKKADDRFADLEAAAEAWRRTPN
ncbi:MAG TPA: serine/threonine-protein kinase [Fibrobacteria bacterium]|nr:serine/threonine-protein kinase [Fibrobacteria bacterium]